MICENDQKSVFKLRIIIIFPNLMTGSQLKVFISRIFALITQYLFNIPQLFKCTKYSAIMVCLVRFVQNNFVMVVQDKKSNLVSYRIYMIPEQHVSRQTFSLIDSTNLTSQFRKSIVIQIYLRLGMAHLLLFIVHGSPKTTLN